MRMVQFQFTISVPGKDLTIIYTLSQAAISTPMAADELLQQKASAYVNLKLKQLPASEQCLKEIKQCQESDKVCQQISEFCLSGWPEEESLSAKVKPYFPMSAELTVEKGLLLRGGRLVVPPPLQKELLNRVHDGH